MPTYLRHGRRCMWWAVSGYRAGMLTECPQCTTRFAADLAFCPHCGWIVPEEEETVPKINDRGPSYRAAELAGEEGPWSQQSQDGTVSEESPESDETRSGEATESGSPAPTTESPSESEPTESGTARTTDGDQAPAADDEGGKPTARGGSVQAQGRTTGRAVKSQGATRPKA